MIGIDKYFSGVVSSAEVGVSKPSPEIFEAALNKAGEEAKVASMLGMITRMILLVLPTLVLRVSG